MVIPLGGNADRGGGDEEEVEQVPKSPGKKTTRRPFILPKNIPGAIYWSILKIFSREYSC